MSLALLLLGGLASLGLSALVAWRRRAAPALPAELAGRLPETVVLLPVRDEEGHLGECLDRLLALHGSPSVVVIDDGSRDRTAAIARVHEQASGGRLRSIAAGDLPVGWRGKVHALARGAEASVEPWLLLTDADARLAPAALERAHAACAGHGLDAISLAGRQEARGAGENLLIPPVYRLLDAWLGDWTLAANGGPTVAAGQFVLVRRGALEGAGGFAAIRTATIDDVALVDAVRRGGGRTGFWRAPDLLSARMYQGLAEAMAGWRRNLAAIFGGRPAAATASLLALLAAPLAELALLVRAEWAAALALWCAGAAGSALARRSAGQATLGGLLHPFDDLALAATLAWGLIDRRRGRLARWKGRDIRL